MTVSQEMEDNTVYTVEKQAQEKPNRFNLIWLSPPYFKVGFFTQKGKKRRIWTKSLLHSSRLPSVFPFSSFIGPGKKLLGLLDELFTQTIYCIRHASLAFPLSPSVSHKLQMQM